MCYKDFFLLLDKFFLLYLCLHHAVRITYFAIDNFIYVILITAFEESLYPNTTCL